jgi:HPr kinase/phosphorylase
VHLADWDSASNIDRTGLENQTTEILAVEMPTVIVPLNPGKNITVVSEIVAMNHLLRYSGVNSARDLDDKLISQMAEQRRLREYLSEDYE